MLRWVRLENRSPRKSPGFLGDLPNEAEREPGDERNEPLSDARIHPMAHGFLKNAVPAPTFPRFDPGRAIRKPRTPGLRVKHGREIEP
ncbi:hypothetical protein SA87_05360 [Hydrogenibacillus schlegelii]|uniref:Uncharacterized protein n=1 Tax=Hydrogenibacillus schlegelii TaxID=1484 RepID=A0A179IR93_HYDSH|nr:hypothetical protein SA87_05360 [Hydrogenibacillus schlegelii]